jgi:hypothetical protein
MLYLEEKKTYIFAYLGLGISKNQIFNILLRVQLIKYYKIEIKMIDNKRKLKIYLYIQYKHKYCE